ncbi:MAG: hypothetical protein ACTSP4_04705 [Candidatus Hodarchaeales archaeon]
MTPQPGFLLECQRIVKKILISNLISTKTGPSYKYRGSSHVLAWNFFFSTESDRKSFWDLLLNEINKNIIPAFSGSSEVINHTGCTGSITDSGNKAFIITKSEIFEIYLYEEETFIYMRLLEEKDPESGKEWISLDIDLVERTPWFLD